MKITERIDKNGKKTYTVRAYIGRDKHGKKKELTRSGLPTKQACKLLVNDEIYKHNNNIGKYDSKTTYKDMYDIWIELYGKNVKESTHNKTIRYMEIHVLPVFGDMEISKIEPTDCQVLLILSKIIRTGGSFTTTLSRVCNMRL